MRKLLLASVATLGFAGSAYAAGLVEINQATSPMSVGDATGVTTPSTVTAAISPKFNPDPGKTIVHFDGLVAVDVGVVQSRVLYGTAGSPNANNKDDHYGMGGVFRLYLGFDGKTTNGIIYGAYAEVRTNFAGAGGSAGGYSVSGALGGGSSNSTASLLYTRRAYTYVGAPNVGLFRLGQGDGVTALFTDVSITTGEAYDTGQWNGDGPDIMPGNAIVAWAFNDTGNEYTPMKIVYMTPSFAGFTFAVDFAPNSAALSPAIAANAASGANNNQASSNLASDWGRPRNMFEVGGRYVGTFGPVAVEGSLAFQKSSVVNNSSLTSPGTKFKGVNAIDAGLGATIFGASVYGHYYGGTLNGGAMGPQAQIPGRSRNGTAWVEGVMYTWGPWTAGASYYTFQSEGATAVSALVPAGFPTAGSSVTLGNRVERGFDTGFTYNIAPGVNVYGDYLWGSRHQVGVNFNDPAGTPRAGNSVWTQAFLGSMVFFW